MPKKDYNWVIGCLTLLFTLIALFGGQLLWNKYAVANPINKAFQNIDGIETVTVGRFNDQGKNSDKTKIYVKLGHVANLQSLYSEMADRATQVDGGRKYEIVIQDNRTPELEQFYYSIHYQIQEAIFTGNFATMAECIEAKANSAGVTAQIYVDTKNIYLKMTKGTDDMYVVIARDGSSQGVK
ncbi:MAG: hypothetical protein K0R55_1308 [Sporomusa sp.]|jgi:hypothetical protein|nr:hypothetical protein [Sporomusa sp.]